VPSEAVMPFAGFLAYRGVFDPYMAAVVSAAGSIAGSLVSYFMGLWLGRTFVLKYGKWFLVGEKELELTERWFRKWGEKAIFICRFIPVVRHLISIPAGIAKMSMPKFLIYTFTGALIWNSFLLYLGYSLKDGWNLIYEYSKEADIAVALIIIAFAAYLFIKRKRKS